jgi:hypothetical protein
MVHVPRPIVFARALALLAPLEVGCRQEPPRAPMPGKRIPSAGARASAPPDVASPDASPEPTRTPRPATERVASDCPPTLPSDGLACDVRTGRQRCAYRQAIGRLIGAHEVTHGDSECDCRPGDGGAPFWRCETLEFVGPLPPPELPA